MLKKFIGISSVSIGLVATYLVGCGGGLNPSGTTTSSSTSTTTTIGAAPELVSGTLQTFADYGTTLPVGLSAAAALKVGNKFYLIGGDIDSDNDGNTNGGSSAIYEATIDSNGNPGTFTLSSWTLSSTRAQASLQVVGNYVYLIGGMSRSDSGVLLNTVERATIDSNGLTSNFTTQAQTLNIPRSNFSVLLTTGYLYVMGGYRSGADTNTIEVASVNTTTGEIGNFSLMTRTSIDSSTANGGLVTSRATHGSARIGSTYYILGGEAYGGGSMTSIEKVTINSDGTLGNFVTATETLAQARNRVVAIPLSGKLYIFGGFASGFLSSVESATISSNALTSSFSNEASLSLQEACENGAPLLTSQGFFYFGGYNFTAPRYKNKIQKAPLI